MNSGSTLVKSPEDIAAAAAEPLGSEEEVVDQVKGEEAGDATADESEDVCEPSFFEEEAACTALLARAAELLPPTNAQLLPSVGIDPQGVAAMLEIRLPAIVDRYQDSPHLLHPHLEALMQPLVELLLRYLPNAAEVWAREKPAQRSAETAAAAPSAPSDGSSRGSSAADAATLVVTSSLGQDLSMFDSDAPKTPLHLVCKALYSIIKTAGEKCCTSHFPNNVSHYEDVFYTLQLWVADPTRQREWEVRYCLLLWLSNLVLVPFSLVLVDTNQSESNAAARLSLSDATLVTASRFLADTSKCREAAALLVARLLTRPDSARHRQLFFDFATFILESSVKSGEGTGQAAAAAAAATAVERVPHHAPWAFLVEGTQSTFSSLLSQPFLLPGVLLAMAKTMKLGRREELVPFAATLLASVSAVYAQHPNDSLLCKTAVKVGQRLVLTMLRKKRAGWRYRRHIASLSANLASTSADAVVLALAPNAATPEEEEEAAEDDDVIDGEEESIETGIGLLLQAIGHKDTVVRWSAAKGVGRVCERLPGTFAGEVMEAVLEVFANAYSDAHWHGGLLTIAELCRRSLVGTTLLARVVPVVAQGLAYDLSKGTYSVGAHVRDAACYTCWSIARAYDAEDLTVHVQQLSVSLIVTALFDREVNVRRAAAAAFQECVGRLGNFEHGIELVTTVDFFSLATLRHAYTVVAPAIAHYDSYRDGMLRELVGVKLLHWDKTIRQMAAISLGLVAAQEPVETVLTEVLPELLRRVEDVTVATRHGAILAVAELIRSLPASTTWTPTHVQRFIHILTTLESSRGFRLRGGEYVRQACCAMLQAMAAQQLKLPDTVEVTRMGDRVARVRTLEVIYSFLRDTWVNILEWVQLAATETFAAVAAAYFVNFLPVFHGKILTELYEGCGADQPPMRRRGFLAAVGGLPATLVNAPWVPAKAAGNDAGREEASRAFEVFLPVLQAASLLSPADVANPEQADAEARRNAVRSLARVLSRVDVAASPAVTPQWYTAIVEGTMMAALQDYATDKRGDVGSFVRLAVLDGLPAVMKYGLLLRHPPTAALLCTPATGLCVLRGVVRCVLEKLDRVRAVAGGVLVTLLLHDRCGEVLWGAPQPPRSVGDENVGNDGAGAELLQFSRHLSTLTDPAASTEAINWHNTHQVISLVGPYVLTRCPACLAHAALEGLIVAAGDLSEHVRKPATAALLSAFHTTNGTEDACTSSDAVAKRLSACFIAVLHTHAHEERMLKPASRVLDLLINESVFAVEQHASVFDVLRKELKHFALNIVVLLSMVPLLATCCRSPDVEVRRGAWALALTMIASRYPKVRAKVAADFYTSLLVLTSGNAATAGLSVEGCQRAMEHLAKVTWDGNDAVCIRRARNELYGMLAIEPPAAKARTGEAEGETQRGAMRPAREQRGAVAATYKSLVQETGY
ncbi:putative tubulin folding cofactor D [Leptomonas pyrrhocoris]|uniref:Putative tubulin folding cofactor D n=1 Tax=Leptomonas pyrrhocoris TaxID=157538 RepID=A0A0N0VEU0_LEPPY|nr:putative tubulin folding cofactor D [Leptomonas pyrrhocoris]KPA79308.1 putative tubulin folding cofactor D [Leptomonas pyrrhocoris]|eukprot:XP_015657747.1 putative tubulin folding cofactor D [Leptomonas pyrrhocoris]